MDFRLKKNYKGGSENYALKITAPSNIALVKYWGKHGLQLPRNPSLSFTLSRCKTETRLYFKPVNNLTEKLDFQVYFEGREAKDFYPKIETFLKRIVQYVPFLKEYSLEIHTSNSFPHSSGIASSASGMAALAGGIIELEKRLSPRDNSEEYYQKKTSFLARLGSGSAARSVQGPLMLWGKHIKFPESSDEFAVPVESKIAPVFKTYKDTILLIDRGQKQVSSSAGHGLMKNHPYAASRFDQAKNRTGGLLKILRNENQEAFIELVESEALTLHAMMMTSDPYYILMKANTLSVIEKVWKYREKYSSKLCFTLDAGANVHLLYPEREAEKVRKFIKVELLQFCQNRQSINDEVGSGIQCEQL